MPAFRKKHRINIELISKIPMKRSYTGLEPAYRQAGRYLVLLHCHQQDRRSLSAMTAIFEMDS